VRYLSPALILKSSLFDERNLHVALSRSEAKPLMIVMHPSASVSTKFGLAFEVKKNYLDEKMKKKFLLSKLQLKELA